MKIQRTLATLQDTQDLAAELASRPELLAGQVIYLRGDLGIGKTTLVRYLLAALGYAGRVKSPTYGLMESYDLGDLQVLHLDLYRLEDAEELEYLGLRDLHDDNTLLLVEWPEKGLGGLPQPDLDIHLSGGMAHRKAELTLSDSETVLAGLAVFAG